MVDTDLNIWRHGLQAICNGFGIVSAVDEDQARWFGAKHLNESPETGVDAWCHTHLNASDFVFCKRVRAFNCQFSITFTHGNDGFAVIRREPISNSIRISNGSREANTLHFVARERFQSCQTKRQLPTTFTCSEVVNFIHNNCANRSKKPPQVLSSEHELECFRRCDQEVRWFSCLACALTLRRVAVSQAYLEPNIAGDFLKPSVDVSIQCSQWCDVENGKRVPLFTQATVQHRKDSAQCLS